MINLRVHTSFMFNEVFGLYSDIKDLDNQNYLVITDTNTYGWHYLKSYKNNTNKIIFGCELAIVENKKEYKHRSSIEDNIVLLAKNLDGAKTIFRLCSLSTQNNNTIQFISYEDLAKESQENIILISTDINAYWKHKNFINDDNLYFGLAPTFNYFEKSQLDIVDRNKIVAISDNLFFRPENRWQYEVVATAGSIDGKSTCKIQANYWNRFLCNKDEWTNFCKKFLNSQEELDIAIQNTFNIANQIEQFEFEKAKLPDIEHKQTLREMCIEGAKQRGINLEEEWYKKQLELELDTIEHKQLFIDYFYIMKDMCDWTKQRMVMGPGRGSCGASLVCYLLGITEFDPKPYNLVFSRFLVQSRKDAPDIDCDISSLNKDKVINYIYEKYGVLQTGRVGRLLNLKARTLYRYLLPFFPDIKIYENKFFDNAAETTAKIDNSQFIKVGNDLSLELNNEKLKDIYKIYGIPVAHGLHPSGVIVVNKQMTEFQSVWYHDYGTKNETRELMMDLYFIDPYGVLKLDCLSLETLDILNNCLKLIGKDQKWLYSVDREDKLVYEEVFKDADTVGVFQFEGKELQNITRKIQAKCFKDICSVTAVARPASIKAGNVDKFAIGNLDKIKGEKLKECLKETRGCLFYQEDLMNIFWQVFHAPDELVHRARKIISKVRGKEALFSLKDELYQYGKEAGETQEDMDEAWKTVERCGSYLYNKAHATAYGLLSYFCAYLKVHYPYEFLLAMLNTTDDIERNSKILKYLIKKGYKIKLYDENLSTTEWIANKETNEILGPLTNLKGVSITKAKQIITYRNNGKEQQPGTKKIFFTGFTKYNFLFEFDIFWQKIDNDWQKYFNNKPIKYINENDNETRTIIFYLIEKYDRTSASNKEYTLLKIYTGEFESVMMMKRKGDELKWKKDNYYIGKINGVFIKEAKNFDINLILN